MIGSLSASTRQANNMARYPGLMGIPQDQGMPEGAHKAMTGELLQWAVRLRCESSYQAGSGAGKAGWETIFNFVPFKPSEGEQLLLRAKQTSGKYLCARFEVYQPLF